MKGEFLSKSMIMYIFYNIIRKYIKSIKTIILELYNAIIFIKSLKSAIKLFKVKYNYNITYNGIAPSSVSCIFCLFYQ